MSYRISYLDNVIDKNHIRYEEERNSWNRRLDLKPNAIIFCHTENDVVEVVKLANEKKLDIRIRSGRHHYEGFSSGDNVFVIDVSNMKEVNIDEEKGIVTIGGGIQNSELYNALNSKGYPFAGGGCPSVGVVGYTLSGGWGYSARLLGLGCDVLIEVRIVNSNGDVIIANEKINSDIFWAIRGAGGGNFGVVTSMTYKLPEKRERATLVLFNYKEATKAEKIDIIKTLQKEFKTMDKRFNSKTAIYNSKINGTGIYMTGIFYGAKEEAKRVLKPFYNISTNEDFILEEKSVWEINNYIQDTHPDFEKYKSGGRFLYNDLNDEEIGTFIDKVSVREEGSIYTAISFYGLGGNIDNYENKDMAYAHRGARFIIGVQSVWEEDEYADINCKFVVEGYQMIQSMTQGSYVGFPIKELKNYEAEYFGENLKRIRNIKNIYDVENLFKFPQGIKNKY
ncbi:MAG: FAD-binding protein [Sarcina sp.]